MLEQKNKETEDLKDMIKFKYIIIFCSVLWFIFDVNYKIFSSSLFDIMTIITSLLSIRKLKNS